MKKILILLLLSLLSGCVTYYTPEVVVEDGVYYAQDDPAYINNAYVSGSYYYAGAAYYPWWSMDYFYLGYQPYGYPYYGYAGYGAYVGGGFSIGISYGYSPWYYPYYSYYSPWYRPHRRYGHHHGRRSHDNYAGDGHGQYAGNDRNNPTDRRYRRQEDEDGNEDPGNRHNRNRTGSYGTSPARRYVSTAPSGYSGNQGMVIRSRETTKTGKSRLEPVRTDPIAKTDLTPSTARETQPVYRSRQNGREIRYRSSPKQGRARTGPVDNSVPAGVTAAAVAPAPVNTNYHSRQGSGNRQSSQGKTTRQVSGKSRSDVSSRPPSRSRSNGSVSNNSRSRPTISSSSRRSSNRSNSGHSTQEN